MIGASARTCSTTRESFSCARRCCGVERPSKPVWALDGGWCALPEDWHGRACAPGERYASVQADRLEQALQRMREEWPWMGLFLVGHWQPLATEDDPLWGYALLNPQGQANLVARAPRAAITTR